VEFELAWAPRLLSTMDYTYRERHGETIYRFKGLPSRRRWPGRRQSCLGTVALLTPPLVVKT
jgi:hypothetical protein